ncbi:MAG TPA: MFS transporter [Stellaceae bacterium]|jgi:CP family cyanate transporter-like MFS transporter
MHQRSEPGPEASSRSLLRLAVLWLSGADLRLTVLAVPPVLPLIHRQFALSEGAVGALSGLPPLLFGLAAIPGSLLIARLGARGAAIVGLFCVAAASAARGVGPSAPMLFAMTFLMAAGIAVVQPALPSLVGEWFARRPGFATAVYANGLLIGEAAAAALTIPLILPLVGGSWPASFAVWSIPVAATALLLLPCGSGARRSIRAEPARWWPDWRHRETWQLGLMLGGTGGLYFASNAFIPDYLHAVGRPHLVTICLAALNLGQLPASLALLLWARRLGNSKTAVVLMQILALSGLGALVAAQPWAVAAGAGLIGFCCAFTLIVTLALPPQIAPPGDVHRLSAGMFAIGYSLSFVVPLLGGKIWDMTGVPAAAFLAAGGSAVIVLACALAFRFPEAH